jgi:poly(3-hydroxybutyrate) depolymerase
MLYHLHDLKNAALLPAHILSENMDFWMSNLPETINPYRPLIAASTQFIERSTRIFTKPNFDIATVDRGGIPLTIKEADVMAKPFCHLKHFQRFYDNNQRVEDDPKVLIVAPLSGHFATLLRDTTRAMLPHHDVYITDWVDASRIPLKEGIFNLQNYIDYLLDFMRCLGENVHIIAVCQPSVPVLAMASLLAEYNEPCQPRSMTLMGGPIDTRVNPGKVNEFADEHSMDWFKHTLITTVPSYMEGADRRVCPGFLMLSGFMSLNLQRHKEAGLKLFEHLVRGDDEEAEAHKRFYDEYRSVLDMPEDYYLDSIRVAFKEHSLPRGILNWRGYVIDPRKIKNTALMTVEGELDDISCPGQTLAAHDLCSSLPQSMKFQHLQKEVGHYGIFNGRRWRTIIQPKIAEMIAAFND